MIKKALIIAAGNGSRLQNNQKDLPKPLKKVAGLTLLERIIRSAHKGGISEVVVVVGYRKDQIIKAFQHKNLGVKIHFVENPDWKKPNGLSVLAAKEYLKENFILLMSDHIFDPQTLAKLRKAPLGTHKALLAVDYKIGSVFDLEDATKVKIHNNQISQIGKQLKDFNALDTGMFLATPELFEALEETAQNGQYSLSNGIQLLASRNQMGTFDIGEAYWHDVDTPASLKNAENFLLNLCRKPTDGIISRNLNRHVSLFITRGIAKTGLSANQVTGLVSIVGILSGYFVAFGDYWHVLLGAFLFKMSSILDGCDGELSKLKMTNSKMGQWLDTLSDNFTYLCFFTGVVVGNFRTETPFIHILGSLAFFGLGLSLLVMFFYLLKNTNSGSLVAIQHDFHQDRHPSKIKKLIGSLAFMVKRDFFALFFLALALFNGLPVILWVCVIGSNLIWLVLLNTQLGVFKPGTSNSIIPKETSNR